MNFVSWFEIPVYDIHRASAFYNAIYGFQMETSQNGEHTMAFFPAGSGIGGALVAGPGCTPSDAGVLIYLNTGADLDGVLGRVEMAGGRIVMPRSFISEQAGSFALFIDSEGNRLALHEAPPSVVPPTAEPTTVPTAATTPPTTPTAGAMRPATKKRSTTKRR
jgi:predicted enzyme related to lactoylglutathione lyase